MAVFENAKQESPIKSVEFSPVSDGNFSFFYIDSPISKEGVKKWLTSAEVGQEVVAETQVGSCPVLVTHGDKPKDELLQLLEKRGEQMQPYQRKKPFSEQAWQTGASMAFVGQLMQLTSSFLRPDRKPDWSLRLFAVPNLLATTWIYFYGAQRSDDQNRLTYLKKHFNEELGTHAPGGQQSLPDIHDNRLDLHGQQKEPETVKQKLDGFLRQYSVRIGEIGLRYFGVIALAFPMNKWGAGLKKGAAGEFKEAYQISRNENSWTHYAGLGSIAGKTIAITSKAEDPYNPKPSGWLSRMREKYTFNTGGALETVAFGALAMDGFRKKKISFTKGGPVHRDYISAIGGALFTIRYVIRFWAPFGVRDMNMPELYAHVTDSLAQMPPDKLPQLVADTAADLTTHFKDKHLKYGEVFTQLLNDLYRYHHIALDNLGTQPEERIAKVNGNGNGKHAKPAGKTEIRAKQTLSNKRKGLKDTVPAPAVSHAQQVEKPPETSLSR